VGGEEDAQDAWRDKWQAHRRTSMDGGARADGGRGNGGRGRGEGLVSGAAGMSSLARPIPGTKADVYTVAPGRAGGGGSPGAGSAASRMHLSSAYPHLRVRPLP